MNFLQKFREFISRPTHSRTMGLLIILVLIFAVFLTVTVAQQQQTIKQHAATNIIDYYGACWTGSLASDACTVGSFDDYCGPTTAIAIWDGKDGNTCCANLGKRCMSQEVSDCGFFRVVPHIQCYNDDNPCDCPTDYEECTVDACISNVCQHTRKPDGTACTDTAWNPGTCNGGVCIIDAAPTPTSPSITPITYEPCTADNVGQDCLKPDGELGSCATDATPYNYCSGSTGCYINDHGCTDSTNGNYHTYSGWCAGANVVSYFECNRSGGACTYKEKACSGGTSCTTISGKADCTSPVVPTLTPTRGLTPTLTQTPTRAPTSPPPPPPYPTSYPPPYPTSYPTSYPTTTVTPTPAAITLVSALNIQDAPIPDSFTANLTLYSLTTNNIVTGAPATQTFTKTAIPDRQYSVNITLTNLAHDKYFIIIRKGNMIAKSVFTVSNSGIVTTVPTTTLVFGDVNRDNKIDITDWNLFKACWKQPASACAPNDFDQTGGTIDQVDFNTLMRGWATWLKEGQGL